MSFKHVGLSMKKLDLSSRYSLSFKYFGLSTNKLDLHSRSEVTDEKKAFFIIILQSSHSAWKKVRLPVRLAGLMKVIIVSFLHNFYSKKITVFV